MDSFSPIKIADSARQGGSPLNDLKQRLDAGLNTRWGLLALAMAALFMLLAFEQAVVGAVRQGELQRSERAAQMRALAACSTMARDALRMACRTQVATQAQIPIGEADALMARPAVMELSQMRLSAGTPLAVSR
jgi:hypothetical protein